MNASNPIGSIGIAKYFGIALLLVVAGAVNCARAADVPDSPNNQQFLIAADISSLPSYEQNGAVYKDHGKPMDAIQMMRNHGYNAFRVRLFVDPPKEFAPVWGAIQSLDYIRPLAKRIKNSGATLILDLHYSDTWADPGKQGKPKSWEGLSFDALVAKVHDYTESILKDLGDHGTMPDMVQIGNEITPGMLFPDGKNSTPAGWVKLARLLNAGSKACREASTPTHKIRVVLHIDNGAKDGTPQWWFENAEKNSVDYDVMGWSFYPEWGGTLAGLKENLDEVIAKYHKDIYVAETSYYWKPSNVDASARNTMIWPQSPAGQLEFTQKLTDLLKAAPEHHGIGWIWWYPEAINKTPNLGDVWRGGADGLWDDQGNALPALTDLKIPGNPTSKPSK